MDKRCGKCKVVKDVSEFSKKRRSKDGLQSLCKFCHSASVRATPSQSNAARKAWRENRTPEQIQRANDRVKRWIERHPFEAKLASMERTARHNWRKAGLRVESFKYSAVLARDGWSCYLCGGDVVECELSFDHVVPLSQGGPHSMENVKVTHIRCNDSKGGKHAAETRWAGRGKSQRGCYQKSCSLHREENANA